MKADSLAPYLRAAVGACGSGKSQKLGMQVDRDLRRLTRPRFLVLDLSAADWPGTTCRGHRFARVKTAAAARLALDAGERLVIVSPTDTGEEAAAALGCELAGVALELGEVTLVLPEAHIVAPQKGGYLPPEIEQLAHRWRHKRVRLWLDTQYTQYISKRLLRACHVWDWFAMGGGDMVALPQALYPPLVQDIENVALLASRGGIIVEPGWHVHIPVMTPRERVIISPNGRRYSPEQAAAMVEARGRRE